MYQLYSIAGSCSTGIHILLNKLQQPVDVIQRDDIADYTALVPTNQVPALKDNGSLLTEGASIALYLLDKHGVDINYEGSDTIFKQWLMFNYATLHPAYSKLFTVSAVMQGGEQKQLLLQSLADRVAQLWTIVDKHLAQKTYMVGESVTIIDYLLAIYVGWGNAFSDLRLPVGEHVLRLVTDIAELPEFKTAFEREAIDYSIPQNAR